VGIPGDHRGCGVRATEERERLIDGAKAVLHSNDLGHSTKPAPDLYPHQWNWDSCFIAIGLSHLSFQRAADEIRSLLRAQWTNGLVPQIVFNPSASGYFPGPDVWQSTRSPNAPRDVETSGITQPPVMATAVRRIVETAPSLEEALAFAREVYPKVVLYHRWLHTERDPDGSGLVVVVHPWESGLDNSPPYLDAGKRVHMEYKPQYERLDLLHVAAKNRPTNKDYDLYVYLLEQMRAVDWDQRRYLEVAQLQVQDVLFSSILCRADRDLAEVARLIGEDPGELEEWHAASAQAIETALWDEARGTYFSRDRVTGDLLTDDTIGAFHTLYGGVASREHARRLVDEHLLNSASYSPRDGHRIPTTAMNSPWFNPENYWLGPVWVNTNWMVMHGLRDYDYVDLADSLRTGTLDLVAAQGYREYFNPLTGEGYGTGNFSWTAALTIDLLHEQ
jgi:neutral trehalase